MPKHTPSPLRQALSQLCYQGTRATRPMRAMRAILEERAWIVIWYLFRKKKTMQKFVDCVHCTYMTLLRLIKNQSWFCCQPSSLKMKLLQQKSTTPYRVEVPAMEKMIFMSLGQLVPSSLITVTLGWTSSPGCLLHGWFQVTQLPSPQSYQPSEITVRFKRGFFTTNKKNMCPQIKPLISHQGVRVVEVVRFPASQTFLPYINGHKTL